MTKTYDFSKFARDVGIPGRATGSSKQEFITKKRMAWHANRMKELEGQGLPRSEASTQAMKELASKSFELEWKEKMQRGS